MPSTDAETINAAQKEHLCDWCHESIEKGSSYKRYRWFDSGDAGTTKLHPECFTAMQEAPSYMTEDGFNGEFPRGCFHDPLDKHCDRCQPSTPFRNLVSWQKSQISGDLFMGLPDAWYERPTWACENGHISNRYLKSEEKGDVCLCCMRPIVMIPPSTTTIQLAEVLAAKQQR